MNSQYVGVCNDLQSRNVVNKKTVHILKNIYFFTIRKNYLTYAYKCRLNQSGQHNI